MSQVWIAGPDLVLSRVEGRFVLAHADSIMTVVDAAIAKRPGHLTVVHDWTAVQSYEIAVHTQMGAWAARITPSLERILIGVTSPFVTLAVRTVNLAVGNRFELFADRERLLQAARSEYERQRGG